MKTVAIIPARGGSKGVPRKNIKLLAGKPLIAYSIEAGLKAKNVDRVFVSTEDEEIRNISLEYGAEVIDRQEELATDTAATEPVLQQAVSYLEKVEGYSPDLVVLLQPTSPLRKENDIDKAISKLIEEKADSLLSVFHGSRFVWKPKNDGSFEPLNYDYRKRPRHQEMQIYTENGSIYVTKRDILMNENCRLGGKVAAYVMAFEDSFEIDAIVDFWIIEEIMKSREGKNQ